MTHDLLSLFFFYDMVRMPSAIRFAFAVTLLHRNVKVQGQLQTGAHALSMLLKDTSAEQMLAVMGLES